MTAVREAHAAAALRGGALKFMLNAVSGDEPLLNVDSANMLAYKSVLKNVLSVMLYAYDVTGLVAQGNFEFLFYIIRF